MQIFEWIAEKRRSPHANRRRGEGIIRAEKCPNSRENGTSFSPRAKKTPFRRSSYLVTIRESSKSAKKRNLLPITRCPAHARKSAIKSIRFGFN
jgi:hypothetical protein